MKRTNTSSNQNVKENKSMNAPKKDMTVRAIALVISDDNESCGQTFGKKGGCNIKDVFTDGDSIAQLYRRFDPQLSHCKNPTMAQVDEAFAKLSDRLKSDETAMILFAYSGHA